MLKLLSYLFLIQVFACNNSSQTQPNNIKDDTSHKHVCTSPGVRDSAADMRSHSLVVSGEVEQALRLTLDSLKKMDVVEIPGYEVVCQSGKPSGQTHSCKGVLLRQILEKAKLKQTNHKDRNFYIVARATDNYKATFSWGEIFNNATGESTYVIVEENGEPIAEKGEFILICTNDIKTGPRHVFWLNRIEVHRVE